MDVECCTTCRYGIPEVTDEGPVLECHRHAPAAITRAGRVAAEWPTVGELAWCGEWTLADRHVPPTTPLVVRPYQAASLTLPALVHPFYGDRLAHAEHAGARRLVIKRDGPWCRYCGVAVATEGSGFPLLTMDHLIPKSRGGANNPGNMVVACARCNNAKGSQTLAERGVTLRDPCPQVPPDPGIAPPRTGQQEWEWTSAGWRSIASPA